MSEHTIQREFVSWMRRMHPDHRIFAIPNGGGRSPSQGARLKVEGVTRGVPDLFVPSLALWIEMKAPGGRLSPEQVDWRAYLQSIGHRVAVCYSVEQAQEAVTDAL